MSSEEIWGPWKRHNGRACPIPDGTKCRVILETERGNFSEPIEGCASYSGLSWMWIYWGCTDPLDETLCIARIVRYQVLNSKEAEKLIQEIKNMPDQPNKQSNKA